MIIRSRKYNIALFAVVLIMCVSYLGTGGLYNPNIRNYAAHSVSSLGGSREIDSGNNDMLMPDSSAVLMLQTRNIRLRELEPSMGDAGELSLVFVALLLSLLFGMCASANEYEYIRHSRRWMFLEYIHKKDGKKRYFNGVWMNLNE